MKKGKYLITGCAGFIGSNLVKKLYKNYELILVDDLSEGSIINLPRTLKTKIIKKKIQNIKNLKIKNLIIFNEDILKWDHSNLDYHKIVGNIPYNISSQIIFKFLNKF